ncbi:AMP deaminase [Astathelohania contejeani]|uniref:AMP deaminase n=1 Tax=Astathelohania contejeani TaxID=164912 RepID=A0ABQ7HW52_9MICR|nr:AMP deaminase [Thelohania contejeani]
MNPSNFSWLDFEFTEENNEIYKSIHKCISLRDYYQKASLQEKVFQIESFKKESFENQPKKKTEYNYGEDGIFYVEGVLPPTITKYYEDSEFIINVINHRPTKSLCFRRLEHLKHAFIMYKNLSSEHEKNEQKKYSRADFYRVVKVDTHIHHSASMNSKHLLKFIKNKLLKNPKDKVYQSNGKVFTLEELFSTLNISTDNLCIDTLGTHALTETFHRFDKFNYKYNPYGQPILRTIFLKHENFNKGKYLSEITKELFEMLEDSKYHYCEYRISIYGRSPKEWDILSAWIVDNELENKHIKWLIQVPRVYPLFKNKEIIGSFGELLRNVFGPLFEVTKNPGSNPKLAKFLKNVVGFDSVDDESIKDKKYNKKIPSPEEWTSNENPPYSYYIYYLYSNILSLNHYRHSKGLNTFSLRPHAGETGDHEHLVYAFLTGQSISHGVQLRKSYPLQYLYYVAQIGISMSPLSNNSLFIPIEKNPFPDFFQKGLLVSLSTDDPLQFHYTKEPLMEEYSIATQVWKLSSADQCELSRNSVLISNFSHEEKKEWIGNYYYKEGEEGNDIEKTNIPNIRLLYRLMNLKDERKLINGIKIIASKKFNK